MIIDNLSLAAPPVAVKPQLETKHASDPKHILLLKTLYGMCEEMLSKNFLEDKRTNQKNLFEREINDNSKNNEK
jgi:hypothetical protein